MRRINCLIISLALSARALSASDGEEAAPQPQGLTEITARQVLVETSGVGEDLRSDIEELGKKITAGDFTAARNELARLQKTMAELLSEKDVQYISVSADAQFADFLAKNPTAKIRRTAWALQKLYFLNAFLLAEQGEVDAALAAIDTLLKYAPYSSDGYCERGYLLNRLGKPSAAVEAYQTALTLAETYNTERHNLAVALRGIGFSQTSLGHYAAAKAAYLRSLEIAPENKIATDGLAGIAALEK